MVFLVHNELRCTVNHTSDLCECSFPNCPICRVDFHIKWLHPESVSWMVKFNTDLTLSVWLETIRCLSIAIIITILKKTKLKWSRYRHGVTQSVGRVIALLFHDRGTRRGVSGQQHALAAIYPLERPGNHFTEGWVGPRAGMDGRKISSPPGFDPGPSSP